MAIVSSYGTLTAVANPAALNLSTVNTSGPFYDGYRRTYAQIYQTQPAVRTVIDFFSRNIAQLGLHAFRRLSEVDRVRLHDHDVTRLIKRPNPSTTRYRFTESTVQDIGIYANAYWLKVRVPRQLGLVRLPAGEMSVEGGLLPTGYVWEPRTAAPQTFAPSEIVHFRLFDPANPLLGFPPLETLRRILAEEAAAGEYRQHLWKNAARAETVIERPKDAPQWTHEQKTEFRQAWQQFAGSKAGMTPVLEHGMTLKPFGFNARDSQYLEARKLSREEAAAAYHVPLPMVGILDHATFSNIREQHKQLYQDTLGPWLVMLEEDIELQLLPEFDDVEDVYLEFNIAEKMKGSFEEQADSLQKAVGRPYMTANEARARLNLPRHTNRSADDRAEAAPGQAAPKSQPALGRDDARTILAQFFGRQKTRVEKDEPEARAAQFDQARWDRELAADLAPLGNRAAATATEVNLQTRTLLEQGEQPWTTARLDALVSRIITEDAP